MEAAPIRALYCAQMVNNTRQSCEIEQPELPPKLVAGGSFPEPVQLVWVAQTHHWVRVVGYSFVAWQSLFLSVQTLHVASMNHSAKQAAWHQRTLMVSIARDPKVSLPSRILSYHCSQHVVEMQAGEPLLHDYLNENTPSVLMAHQARAVAVCLVPSTAPSTACTLRCLAMPQSHRRPLPSLVVRQHGSTLPSITRGIHDCTSTVSHFQETNNYVNYWLVFNYRP